MSILKETLKGNAKRARGAFKRPTKKLPRQAGNPEIPEGSTPERNIEPCKTKEEFYEYAIEEFTKIEGKGVAGKPGEIYADCLGHPTIGVGHLVVHKRDVLGERKKNPKTGKITYYKPNPQNVATYRKKFIELPLLDNQGNPLSDEEKGQKFDRMISMMKAKKRGLNNNELWSIGMGHLDEEGMKQTFAKDVETATNRAIADHPNDFWNMPRSAQASLVHMYFWGKGKTAEKLQSDENTTIGEQLPTAVQVGLKPNVAIRNLAIDAKNDSIRWEAMRPQAITPQQPSKPLNFARMNAGHEL